MPFQAPYNLYNDYPTYNCALLSEFQPGSNFTKGLAGILHTKHYQHILDAISCQDPEYSGHLHTFAVVMGEVNILNFGALKVTRCGTPQCCNEDGMRSTICALKGQEPYELLVDFTQWLHRCKQKNNFALMLPKVVTLAEVHDKEGELFKPLLEMYDAMDDKETSGEEMNGANERNGSKEGGQNKRGGRNKGGDRTEGARNRASPSLVPEYFLSHIKQVCARIGKVALDELVSENDKLAALKSLLDVLDGAGLDN